MSTIEDNLIAFEKGKDMTSLSVASERITNFLLKNLKLLDKKPNISRLLDSQFVQAYSQAIAKS